MSSSFIEFRGRGFWSWDGYLEHLFALLVERIGSEPQEEWLAQLRDHLRKQSSGAFDGWINPNLDEFITEEDRRQTVLDLLDQIIAKPGLTREVQQTAQLVTALLKGELNTDASSPLDYMVSGPQPYKRF